MQLTIKYNKVLTGVLKSSKLTMTLTLFSTHNDFSLFFDTWSLFQFSWAGCLILHIDLERWIFNCSVVLGDVPCFSVPIFLKLLESTAACLLAFTDPKYGTLPRFWCVVGCIDEHVCRQKFLVCKSLNTLWTVIKGLYNRNLNLG